MSTEDQIETPLNTLESISYFSFVDVGIFVILLTASLLVGVWTGWRSEINDTKDFLTGGRTMKPSAVMLSLLGGVVSAISVLGRVRCIDLFIPFTLYIYVLENNLTHFLQGMPMHSL